MSQVAAVQTASHTAAVQAASATAARRQAAPAAAPASAPASAPSATAVTKATSQISGKVTDKASGNPIAGACVTAYNNNRQTLGRTCTGADGRYTLANAYAYTIFLKATIDDHNWWWPGSLDQNYAVAVGAYPGQAPVADFVIERRKGTFRGSLTRQDGTPAIFATAVLYPVGAEKPIAYTADFGSGFERTGLPVGSYHVAFNGSGYATQWYPAKATRAEGATVEITEGGTATAVEQFRAVDPIPTAPQLITVQGTVMQPDDTPVPNAQVSLYGNGLVPVTTVQTDGEGRFAAPNIRFGIPVYTKVSAAGFATTWDANDPEPYRGRTASSTPIAIRMGAGSGRLKVNLKDYDGTLPPPGVNATLSTANGAWTYTLPVRFDGTIDLAEVPAGRYQLKLTHAAPSGPSRPAQWYPAKPDSTAAQDITIVDGQTTEITESMLRPATIEATLLDAVTGAPISGACVHMWQEVCTDVDGVYRGELDWQTGPYTVTATHEPYHFRAQTSVTARPGEVTKVTLKMAPGAVIATTYRDQTAYPAEGSPVCVHTVRGRWGLEDDGQGAPVCAMPAGDGTLLLGPFQPGFVQLFVRSRGMAGAQWLGYQGGTGDRRSAATVRLQTGAVTTAPTIIAAESGGVFGNMREAATNKPVRDTCAQAGPGMTSCGDGGFYHFADLGPYQWAIAYSGPGMVTVRPGEAGAPASLMIISRTEIVADAFLRPGTMVQSFAFGGTAPVLWYVTAYDASTREMVNASGSGFGMILPPARSVVLRLDYDGQHCWAYFGSGSGRTPYYRVGASTISRITLTPGQNCLDAEPTPVPERMPPASGHRPRPRR
ncbi:carboxypeptidase-like regulatory domain-containing protein [Catellatospora vulcania]|uniref:carboxypeptidase-like regulatory domain-containing protein n=1 Tax=Catellatospora vulcania TaxID=1460450 RepID=UPI0012D40DDD|nr:carboxypeptidase-like regulatory domain-containing protein [Catellatospora vulcania]